MTMTKITLSTHDARRLTEDHDPYLLRGDGCFIAPDLWRENWAELMEKSRAWEFAEAFPIPRSVLRPNEIESRLFQGGQGTK
jgi:hypothetical protein